MCFANLRFLSIVTPRYLNEKDQLKGACPFKKRSGALCSCLLVNSMADVLVGLTVIFHCKNQVSTKSSCA